MLLKFPKDFLWGVAASAYQIEGAYDEDNDRDPTAHFHLFASYEENFIEFYNSSKGFKQWGMHFWDPDSGPYGDALKMIHCIYKHFDDTNPCTIHPMDGWGRVMGCQYITSCIQFSF